MKSLWRMALTSTIATYVLIFIGGLVRVSGAGLGCPDWPKCFGRWIPPTDVSQLPPDIDPSRFNLTLAWIEYINRLCGVTVGVLIAITAVLALVKARGVPRILWPAVAAGLLTAFLGWQGSVVIASELEPLVVTVHGVLALLIVSLLIWVAQHAYYEAFPTDRSENRIPYRDALLVTLLWGVAIAQVILGTQMREGLEMMSEERPAAAAAEWIVELGGISHIHMTLGLAVAIFTWWVGRRILANGERLSRLLLQAVKTAMVLVGLQLATGLVFIFIDITPLMQVFHLWLASLYIGALLVIFASSRGVAQEIPAGVHP